MSSDTADLWMRAPCRQGPVPIFLWIPNNLFCSDTPERLIHSCITCHMSAWNAQMARINCLFFLFLFKIYLFILIGDLSLRENMPSIHLMSIFEWGDYIREPEIATCLLISCGLPKSHFCRNQAPKQSPVSLQFTEREAWFPAQSPTKSSFPGPTTPILAQAPGPPSEQPSWLNATLSNIFPPPALQGISPLFSFSGVCFLWHCGAPKFLAHSLKRRNTEILFKHLPHSMK